MARSLAIVLLLLTAGLLVAVNGECQSALQAVTTITNSQTAANAVYQSLTGSSSGVCRLTQTCCSSQAEQLLRQNIITQYQTTLRNNMRTAFQPCTTNTTRVQSAEYIELWRTELVGQLSFFPGASVDSALLDPFTNYMTNGILNLNLPSLKQQVIDMFFVVYHATFKSRLERNFGLTVPDTTAFRNCLKTNFFFVSGTRDGIEQRYRTLEPRMNLLLRYLLALKTSDSVLESIMNHVLSPECGDALLRLTHCKECSGTTSSSPPCTPFCQNVLRGCLVDLTEVGHVLQEFATQVNAMKNKMLNRDDPFAAIDGLTNEVFDIISAAQSAASGSRTEIESTCGVMFPSSGRRRRDVKDSHVIRRQATPSPALTSAAQCAQNVAQFVQNLPNQLCTSLASITGNTNCWNGNSVGSYSKALVSQNRLSIVNNSEIVVIHPTVGLQYRDAIAQLKNMTAQLTSCSGSLDCDVKLVSLSVPSPSDFALTEARYQELTLPAPVNTTSPLSSSSLSSYTSFIAPSSSTTQSTTLEQPSSSANQPLVTSSQPMATPLTTNVPSVATNRPSTLTPTSTSKPKPIDGSPNSSTQICISLISLTILLCITLLIL